MSRPRGSARPELSDLLVTATVAAVLLGGSLFTAVRGGEAGTTAAGSDVRSAVPAEGCAPPPDRCGAAGLAHLRLLLEPRTGICLI